MSEPTPPLSISTKWRLDHFSKLEYLEHKYIRFDLPNIWNEQTFDVILIPSGCHSHERDYVRFIIEHKRTSFRGIASVTDGQDEVPEPYRNKQVAFQLSFLNSANQKCNVQEARLSLFKDPHFRYDPDVEMNIAYDYLLDPNNALIEGDTLTILIEAQIVDKLPNQTCLKSDYSNYLPTELPLDVENDVYYY